ncbi:hypothetical protein SAMN04487897_1392 [Paenibacillus sp. yr247]|uniref:hypothetical protein n=1 Tax=Paenibacillus sp. yr247 TaxID=1761880 RepID=UPI00088FF8D8|nr:hypothetical protein [Paenibacillus sp. yr247]SDP13563.1 hypothetical protein SAMN04487897_1392 [Paenibacillus sp. yr247]
MLIARLLHNHVLDFPQRVGDGSKAHSKEDVVQYFKNQLILLRKKLIGKGPIDVRCRLERDTLFFNFNVNFTVLELRYFDFFHAKNLMYTFFAEEIFPSAFEFLNGEASQIHMGLRVKNIKLETSYGHRNPHYTLIFNMDVEMLIEQGDIVLPDES